MYQITLKYKIDLSIKDYKNQTELLTSNTLHTQIVRMLQFEKNGNVCSITNNIN